MGPEVVEEITRALIEQGGARAALQRPRDARGLHRRGVRRSLALRRRAGAGCDPSAGARGRPPGGPDRRRRQACRRSFPGGWAAAAADRPDRRAAAGRAGGAREQVLRLTGQTGQLVARSIREARRLAAQARAKARGRGAQRKLAAAERLERSADLAETVARQITQRLAGEKITDRLVSLADPDARPIGKGKLGKRYEFGYVFQLAELTANTRRGARGLILPAASQIGSPNENELLPTTAAELKRLGLRPREVALDGGFSPPASNATLPDSTVFVAGRQQPQTRRPRKRLAGYRNGCEGRISHLKRGYGLRRSRLRGHPGARTWVGWGILAYNLDTLAIRTD